MARALHVSRRHQGSVRRGDVSPSTSTRARPGLELRAASKPGATRPSASGNSRRPRPRRPEPATSMLDEVSARAGRLRSRDHDQLATPARRSRRLTEKGGSASAAPPDGTSSGWGRRSLSAPDHRLVTEVDAVEGADRDARGRSRLRGEVISTLPQRPLIMGISSATWAGELSRRSPRPGRGRPRWRRSAQ
jgi:hypothetical protein